MRPHRADAELYRRSGAIAAVQFGAKSFPQFLRHQTLDISGETAPVDTIGPPALQCGLAAIQCDLQPPLFRM